MSKRSGQEQGGIKKERERKTNRIKKERKREERQKEKESSRNPLFTNVIRYNWAKCTAEEEDITEPGDRNHISSSPCSDK